MKFLNNKTRRARLNGLVAALGASLLIVACGGGGGGGGVGDAGGGPGGPVGPQQAWQGSLPVEVRPGQADNVDVAVNASGVAYAVWSQVNGNRQEVFSSRYIDGQWQDALQVSKTVATDEIADLPQVVVHPSGSATAVWTQTNVLGTGVVTKSIVGNSTNAAGVWGNEQVFEFLPLDTPNLGLGLEADGIGAAMAFWSVNGTVVASHFNGVAFGFRTAVSNQNHDFANSPSVAMRNGKAVAVWVADVNAFPAVFYKTFEGGQWSNDSSPLSQDNALLETPTLALQADGKAVVAWKQDGAVLARLASDAFAFVNTGWGTPPEVLGNLGINKFPKAALDPQGRAVVVWEQSVGGDGNILAARFDGTSWKPSNVESANLDATQVRLGMDRTGRGFAVWSQFIDGKFSIFGNRMNPDTGAWGTPELLETEDGGGAFLPSLAVSEGQEGRAVAAWKQQDGTTGAGGIQINNIAGNVFK
jgi:hypothetical protein